MCSVSLLYVAQYHAIVALLKVTLLSRNLPAISALKNELKSYRNEIADHAKALSIDYYGYIHHLSAIAIWQMLIFAN